MQAPLWLVEKGCTRKRWYATKAQARAGKQRAEHTGQEKYRIYRCSWCGGWHLTTKKDTNEQTKGTVTPCQTSTR